MDGHERMDVVASLPKIEPIIPPSAPPAHRPGWLYEEKVDGWRIVAYKDRSHVRLIGRRGVDHRSRFPGFAEAIAALPATSLILDGEVAIFDEQLVSRFHFLWEREPDVPTTPPRFMAFDRLYVNVNALPSHPLRKRRAVLEEEIRDQRLLLPVRHMAADGMEAWVEVERGGYEGPRRQGGERALSALDVLAQEQVPSGGALRDRRRGDAAPATRAACLGEWEGKRLLYRGFVDLGLIRGAMATLRTDA